MAIYYVKNAQGTLINTIVLNDPLDWTPPDGCVLELAEESPPPAKPVLLTQLAFLRRFTPQERIAIRSSTDPIIIDFLHLLSLAQDVRLDDLDTVAGVNYLEQQALLAEGRAAEILG